VLAAHELLRPRILPGRRWATARADFLYRQSAQRCRWTGGSEHEPDACLGRVGRIELRVVVKIGGAALEDKTTLHKCARAVVDLAQDGHQVAVVHGGGSALTRTLQLLGGQGGIPVISSVAIGSDGEYYNVNADQMAAACAVGCQANSLIFLTDVPGVKDADGSVIPWLGLKRVEELIRESVIAGGMLPKLEASGRALHHGVGRVRILPADQAHMLPEFYFSKLECGTEVLVVLFSPL